MNRSAEIVVTRVKAARTVSPENSRNSEASRNMQENRSAFTGTWRLLRWPNIAGASPSCARPKTMREVE